MKLLYVASPIAAFYNNPSIKDPQTQCQDYARNLCSVVKKAGFIPVNAALNFVGVYSEENEREAAMECAFELLKRCDAIAYTDIDFMLSSGIKKEVELAKKLGIDIYIIDWKSQSINKDGGVL